MRAITIVSAVVLLGVGRAASPERTFPDSESGAAESMARYRGPAELRVTIESRRGPVLCREEEFKMTGLVHGVDQTEEAPVGNPPPFIELGPKFSTHNVFVFRFLRDGRPILFVEGNEKTLFRDRGGVVYFVRPADTGGTASAYDLTTGRELWSAKLKAVPGWGAKGYVNRVALRIRPSAWAGKGANDLVEVIGSETAGDYVESFDCESGRRVGHEARMAKK